MNTDLLVNPVATSSVVAVFVCTLLLIILVKSRVAIGQTLAQWRAKVFTRTGFFWIVNLVFMGVSVLHAGDFFGITGKDDFARYLGFAVSFFLDLVTIILMQAMLEARYRGEEQRARQFLFFIVLCCGTSTFANLAISLNDFDPVRYLPHAPMWVQIASPYVLASFPLFVIMMSIAAEMIINVRPLEQLDEQQYEADEKKRLKIMEIRNTYLQMQADEEARALAIRAQMRSQKPGIRLPWSAKTDDASVLIAKATESLRSEYSNQIEALQKRIESLKDETACETEETQIERLFRRHIADEDIASQPVHNLSTVSTREDEKVDEIDPSDEQEIAPINLDERRTHSLDAQEDDPKTNPPLVHVKDARRALSADNETLKRARRIVKKTPDITAHDLATKIGVSRSYAGKLKQQILSDLVPEPA